MKRLVSLLAVLVLGFAVLHTGFSSSAQAQSSQLENASGTCRDDFIFGIPTWYKYLEKKSVTPCQPELREIKDATLILLAVVEALVKVSAFLALAYLIWGGIKYTTSQGSPEGTKGAKDTILNAVIGLVITLSATAIVVFIGNRIG